MNAGSTNLAGVYLAAGKSRRFGSNKLLHDIHGHPLVSYGLRTLLSTSLATIRVIVAPDEDPVGQTLRNLFGEDDRLQYVVNSAPESGMMSSLQIGLRSLPPSCTGAVLFFGDMPLVDHAIIGSLVEAFQPGRIVLPVCNGRWLHPRILPAELFSEYLALGPSESGRVVLERNRSSLVELSLEDASSLLDIDTLDDLSTDVLDRLR